MDAVFPRRDGAVFPHGDDEVLHPPGLEGLGDHGHVLHVDAVGDVDGVAGQDGGLVLVGGEVGGAGEQPVGHGGGWGGVDHHGDPGVVGPLGHRLDDLHRQLELHHHQVKAADLLPSQATSSTVMAKLAPGQTVMRFWAPCSVTSRVMWPTPEDSWGPLTHGTRPHRQRQRYPS